MEQHRQQEGNQQCRSQREVAAAQQRSDIRQSHGRGSNPVPAPVCAGLPSSWVATSGTMLSAI
ncbi:hypothetical protein AMP9_4094 [plant metagenome]|uniref:Uncharacterized protein n=1 Tax=plant metagenome TaxID=1297885 RepID=A0A484P8H9_9ZZZZ